MTRDCPLPTRWERRPRSGAGMRQLRRSTRARSGRPFADPSPATDQDIESLIRNPLGAGLVLHPPGVGRPSAHVGALPPRSGTTGGRTPEAGTVGDRPRPGTTTRGGGPLTGGAVALSAASCRLCPRHLRRTRRRRHLEPSRRLPRSWRPRPAGWRRPSRQMPSAWRSQGLRLTRSATPSRGWLRSHSPPARSEDHMWSRNSDPSRSTTR